MFLSNDIQRIFPQYHISDTSVLPLSDVFIV